MGYGCYKIRLLSYINLEIKRNVVSLFEMRHFGAPHWERLTFLMKLRASSRSSSCFNVIPCMRGTVNGFP